MSVNSDEVLPPISKLNHDILHELFFNMVPLDPESPYGNSHYLNDIHRSSQVCHAWRNVLLRSPLIWAKCIHLDALHQKQDHWHNLVLHRAGPKSLLSVTGTISTPESDVTNFALDLLETHGGRIQVLDIEMACCVLDSERVWKALCCSLVNLRAFSIWVPNTEAPLRYLPSNFQLFSYNTPRLIRMLLPPTFRIPLNIQAPMMFTKNMQDLILCQPLVLQDTDLLAACMQMPQLRFLSIQKLSEFKTSHAAPSLNLPCVHMPHLSSIYIRAPTLEIYAAFLDRIVPHAGCQIYIEASLFSGYMSERSTEMQIRDAEHMQGVITRYLTSYIHHLEEEQPKPFNCALLSIAPSHKLEFNARTTCFGFSIAGFGIPIEIFHILINTILAIEYPDFVKRLGMYSDRMHLLEPPMLRVFHAFRNITSLETTPSFISYLDKSSNSTILFPSLKNIYLMVIYHLDEDREQLLPFLERRHGTNPVNSVTLSPSRYSKVQPLGDYRFLDILVGLKVRWYSGTSTTPREYVCGSGRVEQLLLLKGLGD